MDPPQEEEKLLQKNIIPINDDLEEQSLIEKPSDKAKRQRLLIRSIIIFAAFIAAIILILVLLLQQYHGDQPSQRQSPVILISLDGFASRYLNRNITPSLQSLISDGVNAPFIKPEFPSKTFSNHWSIVTGLLPSYHGIVGNQFYDPQFNQTFAYWNNSDSQESKWWKGSPIWNQLKNHGLKSHICFWPGSEAEIEGMRPDLYMPYEKSKTLNNSARIDLALEWVDQRFQGDQTTGPDLIALYMSTVDEQGHQYGPDSEQLNDALRQVDYQISRLIDQLKARSHFDKVNIIVISDHGMAATNNDKIIFLDKIKLPDESPLLERVNIFDSSPVRQIWPKNPNETFIIYETLKNESNENWNVYGKEQMFEKFQYGQSDRIAPIIVVANNPYSILTTKEEGLIKGTHGYDPNDSDMRSIFIAHGPQFQKGYTIPQETNMSNLEVFRIILTLFNITAPPNNGSISLEFLKSN